MDRITKLVLCVIPNEVCNLKCGYCYISQVKGWTDPCNIRYSPEYIAACLSKKRIGGTALINLTAKGETLLVNNITEIIKCFLMEGHYIEIVTNGTVTKKIKEILEFDNTLLERVFFKVSFHYAELVRLNALDSFFANVDLIKESPASFTLELMANDNLEDSIETISKICKERVGANCHATIGRDDSIPQKPLLSKHSEIEFREKWKQLDSDMLEFKMEVLGKKRREFCYAGKWSIYVDLITGEARQCYMQPAIQNIYKNPNSPIHFWPVGYCCTLPYCVNAHSHLAWGLIPEIDTPYYYSMRNRTCDDGNNWLNDKFGSVSKKKLYEANKEYSKAKKLLFTIFIQPGIYLKGVVRNPYDILSKMFKKAR